MKTKISLIIVNTFFILIFGILPFNAQANDCTTYSGYMEGKWFVVEGENDPNFYPSIEHPWWSGNLPCTKDVYNVQCAVLNHSKVKLRGNFDFGVIEMEPPESFSNKQTGAVSVHKPIEIVGDNATIHNGRHVFTVLGIPGLWPENPIGTHDVTIRNITFVHSMESVFGIHGNCNSFNIDDVVIKDMVVIRHTDETLGYDGDSWKHAISSHGEYLWPWGLHAVLKIGTISITNSHIDLGSYHQDRLLEYGTQHGRAVFLWGIGTPNQPTNIIIRNNEILNTSSEAILCSAWAGTVEIKNNNIKSSRYAAPWPWFNPIGISTGQASWKSWYWPDEKVVAPYQEGWAKLKIIGNEIEMGFKGSNSISPLGLWINQMSGAVIEKNTVQVHSGLGHVLVEWGLNEGLKIEKNKLSGSGSVQYAIGLIRAINSSIKKNDLSRLEAYETQLKMEEGVYNNSVKHNEFGSGGPLLGGIYCNGSSNKFVNNSFHGDFSGWDNGSGFGFMYLGDHSSDNHVVALKNGMPPHGGDDFDICDQVLDEGINNRIQGYDECF